MSSIIHMNAGTQRFCQWLQCCCWSVYESLPPSATDATIHKSLIHLHVPLVITLNSASNLHAAHSIFPVLLHRLYCLCTPKHFPFKPHLPHPHMALSALQNKQVSEPLTTTPLKPVLTISCGIISCFLKSVAICQSLPTLGPNTTCMPRKASLLHFSSLISNCNTFLPIPGWSNFNQLLSHAAKAIE